MKFYVYPLLCISELFYGGEALTNADQPQSFTCPYCSRMGFTDVTLQDHVTSEHADTSFEVVCSMFYCFIFHALFLLISVQAFHIFILFLHALLYIIYIYTLDQRLFKLLGRYECS